MWEEYSMVVYKSLKGIKRLLITYNSTAERPKLCIFVDHSIKVKDQTYGFIKEKFSSMTKFTSYY